MNQKGQVILILILVMTVALGIGISVIQRSLSDVSTASKVEQSSRAFSAAEAGIESKLVGGPGSVSFTENGSTAQVLGGDLIPAVQSGSNPQDPLEYPPLAKEEIAHVWLADYTKASNPPPAFYTQASLDVYWGNSATDFAALELTLVYYNGSSYQATKWYLDNKAAGRTPTNKFTEVDCTGNYSLAGYQCKYTIGGLPSSPPSILMLLRARLLYNSTSQPFAVQAVNNCGLACSLPPQAKSLISTGTAGTTKRTVKLFQIDKVVPPYFDYAIFSTGDINK